MDAITKQKSFWSDDDEMVLKAIREGFLSTQQVSGEDSLLRLRHYICVFLHLFSLGHVERPS